MVGLLSHTHNESKAPQYLVGKFVTQMFDSNFWLVVTHLMNQKLLSWLGNFCLVDLLVVTQKLLVLNHLLSHGVTRRTMNQRKGISVLKYLVGKIEADYAKGLSVGVSIYTIF